MLATLFGGKLLNLLVVEWYIGTVAWSIGTQNYTYKGDKIMTRKETLERVADELVDIEASRAILALEVNYNG